MAPHQRDAFERLQRPQQHARAHAFALGADVERVPAAVDEIHIGVAAVEKQRAVARRRAAVGVPGRVADDVGLGLDDAAAHAPVRVIVDERLADEESRQRRRIGGKIGAAQPTRRSGHGPR